MEDILYLTDVPQRNLSLIAVIDDQYLIMEALDNDALGTGKMYYFDMVAREFMSQTTAELQITNFPLQAEATPTPPIAITNSIPHTPQHPTASLKATIPPLQPHGNCPRKDRHVSHS